MGDTRVKGGQQVEDGGQQGGGTVGLKVGRQQGGGWATARWRGSRIEGRRQQGGGWGTARWRDSKVEGQQGGREEGGGNGEVGVPCRMGAQQDGGAATAGIYSLTYKY